MFDSLKVAPAAIWAVPGVTAAGDTLWPGIPGDSAGQGQAPLLSADNEPDTMTVYFRKEFSLNSKPINGWIAISGDNSYHLYLNDIYITGIDKTEFEKTELIPFSTFENFVAQGNNLLAVSVIDTGGEPHYGLRLYLHLELLPGEMSDTIKNIRSRMGEENIDPARLQKSGVLNKNRIVD